VVECWPKTKIISLWLIQFRLNPAQVGLETCWNEFIEMWRYRRTLLDQGWIELTLSITEPQNGDTHPAAVPFEHWQPGKSQDRYNGFKALTGIEENA